MTIPILDYARSVLLPSSEPYNHSSSDTFVKLYKMYKHIKPLERLVHFLRFDAPLERVLKMAVAPKHGGLVTLGVERD